MRLAIDFDGNGEDEVLTDLERYDLSKPEDQTALIRQIRATMEAAWQYLPANLRRTYNRKRRIGR